MTKIIRAKPFIKWAGGKGALLGQINGMLPHVFFTNKDVTYVEPFVGGGALLFYVLNHFPTIKRVIINDINEDLIACYKIIKEEPKSLIGVLNGFDNIFWDLDQEEKKRYYYLIRGKYNQRNSNVLQQAAMFYFLNHTCFNGLYRVNSNSDFNVPFGKNSINRICNPDLIMADHTILNKVNVTILCGSYQQVLRHIRKFNKVFFYLDPPYLPISVTSYFKQYSNSPFEKEEQVELKYFCDIISNKGGLFMLSNSDCRTEDGASYFEQLYSEYYCHHVSAKRFINAHGDRRASTSEVLICNYKNKSFFRNP
ncbi:MAG: Dam family site-specific DNA-(adenine-N6)-methyltransferase [Bacteroidales bacterium]|nr:Dam family site-specific DNA-(adenine-N6)-methyltransferase [Bacteroidales bacterium]